MRFTRDTRLLCVSLAGSTVFHGMLLGTVVALLLWVLAQPAVPHGQQQPVVLRAVFSPHEQPQPVAVQSPAVTVERPEPVIEAEINVVVMPRSAEIRQQHYHRSETVVARVRPANRLPEPAVAASQPKPRVAPPSRPARLTPTLALTGRPGAAASLARRRVAPPSLPAVEAESVGREVEESATVPKLVYSPPPLYPREAEVRGQEGTVRLWVRITKAGRVASVRIATSSGHGILDAAALRAVRNWRFEPARKGGEPVEVTRRYYVRFRL